MYFQLLVNLFLIRLIGSARVFSQHCLRGPETVGIVDYRGVGKRDHRVDPGRGHQEPRTTILAGSGSRALLQLLASLEERAARRQQRLGNCRQRWVAGAPDGSGRAWRYGGCGCGLAYSIKAPFGAPGDPEIEEDERVDDRQLPALSSGKTSLGACTMK